MARGALGWSQTELAEAAGIHVQTIKRMETQGFDGVKPVTVDTVREAFIATGIRFSPNGCVCPPDEKKPTKGQKR